MSPLKDVDAYLSRIGLTAPATFAEVHRAHATSIAFENFDPYSGRPVRLDPAHLEDKLVTRSRGGYCFEHNLLLLAALESLGVDEVVPCWRESGWAPRTLPARSATCCSGS